MHAPETAEDFKIWRQLETRIVGIQKHYQATDRRDAAEFAKQAIYSWLKLGHRTDEDLALRVVELSFEIRALQRAKGLDVDVHEFVHGEPELNGLKLGQMMVMREIAKRTSKEINNEIETAALQAMSTENHTLQ